MWIHHQSFFTAYEERFGPLPAPKLAGLDILLGYLQLVMQSQGSARP